MKLSKRNIYRTAPQRSVNNGYTARIPTVVLTQIALLPWVTPSSNRERRPGHKLRHTARGCSPMQGAVVGDIMEDFAVR